MGSLLSKLKQVLNPFRHNDEPVVVFDLETRMFPPLSQHVTKTVASRSFTANELPVPYAATPLPPSLQRYVDDQPPVDLEPPAPKSAYEEEGIREVQNYAKDEDSLSYDPPANPAAPFLTAVDDAEAPRDYIESSFESFHADNPEVYRKLVELAFLAKANGHKQLGIKTLFERLRWYYTVETKGNERFRLNNNFTALYARLIMSNEPGLDGFFATRARY